MADIVTFDPVNRLIIEIPTGGDVDLSVLEIYSEWKVWAALNAQWPAAMSVVGGDPLTDTLDLGSTFFLENGWRFRPAELSHRVYLTGNLWTREPGEDVSVDTLGPYRVTVSARVSNLVDSSVARLDLLQLLSAVYIDVLGGYPGTTEGIGSPSRPSNNLADALTIAQANNIRTFKLYGALTITSALSDWRIEASGSRSTANVVLTGSMVANTHFSGLTLTGDAGGYELQANDCYVGPLTNLHGDLVACDIIGDIHITSAEHVLLINCATDTGHAALPHVYMGANATIHARNWSGELEVREMSPGAVCVVGLDPGAMTLNADCTGGTVVLRGVGSFINNAPSVTVDESGFVRPSLTEAETRAIVLEEVWDTAMSSMTGVNTAGTTLRDTAANAEATIAKVNTL
jgi:hypothetical protein